MRSRRPSVPGLLVPILLALPLGAAAPAAPTPNELVAAAPASAWRTVPADRLLVMRLAGGQRVVIELAPAFAPVHVANILALARAGWWRDAAIVRVQDDYVVQWSKPDAPRTLPPGVVAHPAAEYDRPAAGLAMHRLATSDAYAPRVGYADGWPVAGDGSRVWLAHCYGMVGVGRDMPPDTGNGSELYAVIGQAPRQLDRNIALVGRIVDGMTALTALPRGTKELGFYARPDQRLPIRSVQVAADLPPPERPVLQEMRADSPVFDQVIAARASRHDPFFVRPAGGVDLCNAPPPTRLLP